MLNARHADITDLLTTFSNFKFCIWTQPCNRLHLAFRSAAESCNRPNTFHRPIPNCHTFVHRSRRTLPISTSTPTPARRALTRRWFGVKRARTISIYMPRRYRRWARRLTSRATRWGRATFARHRKKGRPHTRRSRPLTITRDSAGISRKCRPTMITIWARERTRRWSRAKVPHTSSGTSRSRRRPSRSSRSSSIQSPRTVARRRRFCTIVVSISPSKRRTACWTKMWNVRTRKARRTRFSDARRRRNCTAFTTTETRGTRWPRHGAAEISLLSSGRRWTHIIKIFYLQPAI